MADAAPPRATLDHLAFFCADAEATRRFYADVMGLPLAWAARAGDGLMMMFALEPGRSLVFTCGGDGGAPAVAPGGQVAHVGLVVADAEARARWKQRLAAHGVAVTVEDAGSDERLYFADPNGVVFEIEAASPPPAQSPSEALALVRAFVAARRGRP